MEKSIYVITGGPGFGKSAIIEELKKRSYNVFDEYAREIIIDQVKHGGDILPWKNRNKFRKKVLDKRITAFDHLKPGINFADRGIVDQVGFTLFHGDEPDFELLDAANRYEYQKIVFYTPPWKEIYSNDLIRNETYEEAEIVHDFIVSAYQAFDYEMIEIPKESVFQRADFILNYIKKVGQ